MTKEEAIARIKDHMERHRIGEYPHIKLAEALNLALSALRPVSREQVEKVFPGCQMCEGWNTIKLNPCANGDLGVQADIGSSGKGDTFGLVVYNRRLASGYVNFQFCPFCGKPKTDEAVEMVMERINKLLESGRQE